MSIQQREKNMEKNIKGAGAALGEAASEAGCAMGEAKKDAFGRTGEAVKDAATTVAHKAADAGSYVAHQAADAGSYVAHQAENATAAVGGELKSLAGTIRDKGPHDGMLGNASSAVASTLDTCGRELQEHGLSGIADDLTNMVRRHPMPAVLIGIGLGFLLARVLAK